MTSTEGASSRGIRSLVKAGLLAVVACEAAGAVAGWATRTSVETWYPTLAKPWFTPPDWLFAPVWIVLYAMMGVAAALVWTSAAASDSARRQAVGVFAGQLVLNVAWSLVFFGAQQIGGGLVVIAGLWLAIAATVDRFARIHRLAAWLLAPYLLWVTYAAALNVGIWALN
jgi:tryptophan-rich sensory protein